VRLWAFPTDSGLPRMRSKGLASCPYPWWSWIRGGCPCRVPPPNPWSPWIRGGKEPLNGP